MKLVCLPDDYLLNHDVTGKIVNTAAENDFNNISKVIWRGVLKPAIAGVEKTITDVIRYEEIQFFVITLNSRDGLYEATRMLCSKVKYPCVIEFHIDDVIVIGVCPFQSGKCNETENVHLSPYFSHFLREGFLSPQAERMVERINDAIKTKDSIGAIYQNICNAVISYQLGGHSKAHVRRLCTKLIGRCPANVMRVCQPYKYYRYNAWEKYDKNRQKSACTLVYDDEELWYAFMRNAELKNVIEKRRYRDMEDMVTSIDEGW